MSTEGGGYHPFPKYIVLEDRYESPLSTDTKNLPVAIHLMSQWRQRHKKLDFTDFHWK